MNRRHRIAILSDVHYAGPMEQARGDDYEFKAIPNRFLSRLAKLYRNNIWLLNPTRQNHLLDRFMADTGEPDLVIANGDYCCDCDFVGVSDEAACESVSVCLGKLRSRFGDRFHPIFGDHELGKLNMFGAASGLRQASWVRATGELGLKPFWKLEVGNRVLMGVTSTLISLPLFNEDMLPQEKPTWEALRAIHLAAIREAFSSLRPDQRVLLFCHDPTAVPFLWREDAVRAKVGQIEQTIVGHLHTKLVFWKGRMLSGMPRLRFLGHGIYRMTAALNEARYWRPFRVRLCPSLAGCELLKDGGWLSVELDEDAKKPARFEFHPIKR